MAPSMACAPTQTEYSHKGRVSSGGTPSAAKPAPKVSATNHDAATRLNKSPCPPQPPPRLSHQRSTATMIGNATQVVTSPMPPMTTPSHAGTPGGMVWDLGSKPISTPMSETASTDCQRGKIRSGNVTLLSNIILLPTPMIFIFFTRNGFSTVDTAKTTTPSIMYVMDFPKFVIEHGWQPAPGMAGLTYRRWGAAQLPKSTQPPHAPAPPGTKPVMSARTRANTNPAPPITASSPMAIPAMQ